MLKTLSIFLGLMIVSASAQAAPACEQNRTVTCLAHDGRVVSNSYCDQHTDKIGQATTRLQQTCRLPEEVVQTETRETVKRCTKPWQVGNYTIRERQVTTETVTCDVTVGEWENPPKNNNNNNNNGYSTFSGWGSSSSGTSAAPHAASSSSSGNSFFGGLVRKASSLAQDYISTASTPETVITPCRCTAGYVIDREEEEVQESCPPFHSGYKRTERNRELRYAADCSQYYTEWQNTLVLDLCRRNTGGGSPGNRNVGGGGGGGGDLGVASYVDTDGDGITDTATLSAGDGNYNGGNSLGGSTSSQVSVQNNNDGTTSVRGNDTSGGGLQTGGVVNPR